MKISGSTFLGAGSQVLFVMTSRRSGWSWGGLGAMWRVSRSMLSGSSRSERSSLKSVTRG